MGTIPELEPRPGYPYEVLPDGVFPADEPALRTRFVDGMPASQTREAIYSGLLRLRADAVAQGLCATQWIDGSFVESKLDPCDVDLVTFIDFDAFHALPQAAQDFANFVLAGEESTRPAYRCHTMGVLSCDSSHRYFATFERNRQYWRKWFGRAHDKRHPDGESQPERVKGFVSLVLGDAAQAPVIGTARS